MEERHFFVLDASAILNLYRYPKKARDDLVSVLKKISDRLWIPHQAALEYQRNRLKVVAEQKSRFAEARGAATSAVRELESYFSSLRNRHALIDPEGLLEGVRTLVANFTEKLDELEKTQFDVQEDDPIRAELDSIFAGKIGAAPTAEAIAQICQDGARRFATNEPPGLMDEGKGKDGKAFYSYGGVKYEARFGDLILWEQLLRYAQGASIKSVIFITDDNKPDWWLKIDSKGEKNIGPRPELIEEIRRRAGVEGFYMYGSAQFLQHAHHYLRTQVSEDTIADVREAAESFRIDHGAIMRAAVRAEFVVENWFADEDTTIIRNPRDWSDFRVVAEGRSTGIDVMLLRRWSGHFGRRLHDHVRMGEKALRELDLDAWKIVIVCDECDAGNRLLSLVSGISLPPRTSIVVGRLVSDATLGDTFGFDYEIKSLAP